MQPTPHDTEAYREIYTPNKNNTQPNVTNSDHVNRFMNRILQHSECQLLTMLVTRILRPKHA